MPARFLLISLFMTTLLTARDSLTVYVFLLDECRISQESTPYLKALYAQWGQNVGFAGYFPNQATTQEAMVAFGATYGLAFPLALDHAKEQAKKWNATILPEVILYNESNQSVVYRGLINDLYVRPGKRRHHIKNHYLADALRATRAAETVRVAVTTPVGCFINYQENE